MQVPERLALIGGSILLASTLIFTLKSQASSIVPNVGHSISSIYDHISDAQPKDFDGDYQQAQKKGWQTGSWGTAKFYVDDQQNMYVGSGNLHSNLANNIGNDTAKSLKSINIEGNLVAPQDSSFLFSTSNLNIVNDSSLTTINGLDRVDTSQATNMDDIFSSDHSLDNLDLSHWDVSHVQSMGFAFYNNQKLSHLNVSNWNVKNMSNMFSIFSGDSSLSHLDIQGWDTRNIQNMGYALYNDHALSSIELGNDTYIKDANGATGISSNTWQNGNQTVNGSDLASSGLNGAPAHPGTWTKQ